jgi:hypothetical protein
MKKKIIIGLCGSALLFNAGLAADISVNGNKISLSGFVPTEDNQVATIQASANCKTGFTQVNGAGPCVAVVGECLAGTYMATDNATECTDCQAGFKCAGGKEKDAGKVACSGPREYQTEIRKSNCEEVRPGFAKTSDSTAPRGLNYKVVLSYVDKDGQPKKTEPKNCTYGDPCEVDTPTDMDPNSEVKYSLN